LQHNHYFYPEHFIDLPKLKTLHMRKFALLSVLFMICSLAVIAQEKSKGRNRTGFRAGANYFAQRIEVDGEYGYSDFRPGFTAALFREIWLGERFVFQPELAYNRMGGEKNETVTKLDYLSLPLLLKLQANRLGIYAGPQFSLLLGGKSKSEFGMEEDVKDSYNSADFSGILGVEYSLGSSKSYVISARYQFSMNDVQKDAEAGQSIRNTGVQLTFGFRF